MALCGGEDYELLFTASPEKRKKIADLAHSLNVLITRIGKILPSKEGIYVTKIDGENYSPSRLGFEHFR